MILKGSQRAGGRQMAIHLLNGEQNEHVTLHEIRGFIADDVMGALNEAYAISQATKCKQFIYSLSLNPPQDKKVPVEAFENALERIERKLGLEGQPRLIVFHEKHGRRHAHCVWSRINADEMKAINIAFPKLKLNEISKSLYLENGWDLPKGFIDKNLKSPLNYTRSEWQQAARTGQNPKAIKASLQESWAISDNRESFNHALQERGYYLAKGDRRGFVAVDIYGEVYSLTRQLGVKKKELEARLGKAENLPSVSDVKANITNKLSGVFKGFIAEQDKEFKNKLKPLLTIKRDMTKQHRIDRAAQKDFQEKRMQDEELKRSTRIRHGFKGLWDKVNGRYWKMRKRNEQESWQGHLRDRKEREELINRQLAQRQELQLQLNQLRANQEQDRQALIRDLSHMTRNEELNSKHTPDFTKLKEQSPARSTPNVQDRVNDKGTEPPDLEPEL